MKLPSDNREDWIWFAGLFEGEGCIYFQNVNSVVINITSTDKDVIEKCVEIAGGKMIEYQPGSGGRKLQYRWRLGTADKILEVLDWIEPFLGKRRAAKAQGARERIDRIPDSRKRSVEGMIAGRRRVPKKEPKLCSNCDRGLPVKARGRCNSCYEYLRRHGKDRPAEGIRLRKRVANG